MLNKSDKDAILKWLENPQCPVCHPQITNTTLINREEKKINGELVSFLTFKCEYSHITTVEKGNDYAKMYIKEM